MLTSTITSTVFLPRVGPKPLIASGLSLGAVGMVLLTQVTVNSTYATHVLPGLLVMGLGLGLSMAAAMNTATSGVRPDESGVASATVNTMQQVGGSIGTPLLSTLAASATSGFVASHATAAGPAAQAGLAAQAAVHGYVTPSGGQRRSSPPARSSAVCCSAQAPRRSSRQRSPCSPTEVRSSRAARDPDGWRAARPRRTRWLRNPISFPWRSPGSAEMMVCRQFRMAPAVSQTACFERRPTPPEPQTGVWAVARLTLAMDESRSSTAC